MIKYNLDMEHLYLLEQRVITDERGYFARLFSSQDLEEIGISFFIKQINFSSTIKKGTIRGIHYQVSPFEEAKIFKCLKGSFCHTLVDMREKSATYLQHRQVVLKSTEFKMLHVPEGIAHGMQSLENDSEVVYFSSEAHHPESERLIHYADPVLNIKWPITDVIVSQKDSSSIFLNQGIK